jgi:hypothetical protein
MKSKIGIIKEFFGLRPDTTTKDFMTEIKGLSPEDRLDLAQGAAIEMGLSQDQVDFPLTGTD